MKNNAKPLIVRFLWIAFAALVISMVLSGLEIYLVISYLSRNTELSVSSIDYLLELSKALFMFVLLVGFIGLFIKDIRRASIVLLIMCMVFLVANDYVRYKAYSSMANKVMERLSRNSAPLVNAIDRFRQERGKPPESLLELMPSYIDRMPETDFQGNPYFLYVPEGQAQIEYKQPWALYIELPLRLGDIMRCSYFPETKHKWECLLTNEALGRKGN